MNSQSRIPTSFPKAFFGIKSATFVSMFVLPEEVFLPLDERDFTEAFFGLSFIHVPRPDDKSL
jgi:hypothetical protein